MFVDFPSVEIGSDDGMTVLIRDRAQEDKLVKVIEPLDTVELTYLWDTDDEDWIGRLIYVKIHWPYYNGVEVNQLFRLYYGDYINSLEETESVLLKIRQSTDIGTKILEGVTIYRTCPVCPVYDDLDAERLSIYNTNNLLGFGGDEA